MLYVSIFFAFAAGVVLTFWYVRFMAKKGFGYVLVYDGAYRAFRGRRVAAGVVADTPDGKITYPANVVHRVLLNAGSGLSLFVVAVEPIALANHDALEVGRRGIAFASMFKSGGDLLRFLQIGAAIIPIIAVIWLTLQIGSLNGTLTSQSADLKMLRDVVSKPLVVQQGK